MKNIHQSTDNHIYLINEVNTIKFNENCTVLKCKKKKNEEVAITTLQ